MVMIMVMMMVMTNGNDDDDDGYEQWQWWWLWIYWLSGGGESSDVWGSRKDCFLLYWWWLERRRSWKWWLRMMIRRWADKTMKDFCQSTKAFQSAWNELTPVFVNERGSIFSILQRILAFSKTSFFVNKRFFLQLWNFPTRGKLGESCEADHYQFSRHRNFNEGTRGEQDPNIIDHLHSRFCALFLSFQTRCKRISSGHCPGDVVHPPITSLKEEAERLKVCHLHSSSSQSLPSQSSQS